MYTIDEFDKGKTKVLKYILYKKRTESEIRTKFSKEMEENLLEDIIEYLKQNQEILDEVESKVRANAEKAFEESLGEEIPEIDMDDDGEE